MSKSNGVLGRPVTIRAHAKINLDLRVLGTRPDGFHELRTVFQALALHDTIECIPREGPFAIECDAAGVPLDRSNLVWRAADALWRSLRRDGPVRDVARPDPEAHSAAGRSRRRQHRRRGDVAWRWRDAWRVPVRPNQLVDVGGHARRRRRVLPVGRHGARPRPRRRDLSARRPAASLDRAARARIRRVDARCLRLVRRRTRPRPRRARPRGAARARDHGRPARRR